LNWNPDLDRAVDMISAHGPIDQVKISALMGRGVDLDDLRNAMDDWTRRGGPFDWDRLRTDAIHSSRRVANGS
jgi:hypothetical protein